MSRISYWLTAAIVAWIMFYVANIAQAQTLPPGASYQAIMNLYANQGGHTCRSHDDGFGSPPVTICDGKQVSTIDRPIIDMATCQALASRYETHQSEHQDLTMEAGGEAPPKQKYTATCSCRDPAATSC